MNLSKDLIGVIAKHIDLEKQESLHEFSKVSNNAKTAANQKLKNEYLNELLYIYIECDHTLMNINCKPFIQIYNYKVGRKREADWRWCDIDDIVFSMTRRELINLVENNSE